MRDWQGIKGKLRGLALGAAAACVLTLAAGIGLLDRVDWTAADALYQHRTAADDAIVLVEIDQRALDEIGPYQQWGRDVIAMVLEALNQSDDCRPAVIAVDMLYLGESDPEMDEWLAEAAGAYGNVITANAAQFADTFVEENDGIFYRDHFAVLGFEEPYTALRELTQQGHINAMMDRDGVLRHHLLYIDLPDGRRVPSLALAAAEAYRAFHGLEPQELPPVDGNGFWYLPFCGMPGDFDASISVADLLSGEIPAEEFADRLVLIGPYTVGLQDSYITAADHAQPMYGVEYHANAIQALLWGDFRTEVSAAPQLALLFVILLAAFAGFWRRGVGFSTLLWAVLSGGWLLLCKGAYGAMGLVLHVLWVPVGVTVLYAACLALNYIRAARERWEMKQKFGQYVDKDILEEILKQGKDALEGKRTRIAVLFVDVRGFTTMSEKMDKLEREGKIADGPKTVVKILDRYLELVTKCVMDHHGTLDKFVGDAAMAFWGAPVPQEDYVMNAVRAAADMAAGAQELVAVLKKELEQGELKGLKKEDYEFDLSFGIGVHVGDCVVGNMGTEKRMDYTAIGDTVNTAARLEANAPRGTIYISRAVADELKDRIRVTSLGDSVKLKGKDQFEVLIMEEIL